jgi:hypothetical protein
MSEALQTYYETAKEAVISGCPACVGPWISQLASNVQFLRDQTKEVLSPILAGGPDALVTFKERLFTAAQSREIQTGLRIALMSLCAFSLWRSFRSLQQEQTEYVFDYIADCAGWPK